MRIAILVHDITAFGGVEYVSTLLAKKLSKDNMVDILSLRNNYRNFFEVEDLKLINIGIPSKKGRLTDRDHKTINSFILSHDYDLIIVQLSTVFRNLCPLADIRLLKILSSRCKLELVFHESPKYFITRYNVYYEKGLVLFLRYIITYLYYNPFIYYFMYGSRKYVSKYVTLSRGCQRELLQYFNLNSIIRYNPYDFVAKKFLSENKKHKIIWAGRCSAEKNLILLVQAWHKIREKKDWCLEIVGSGDEKNRIRRIIETKHIDNIILTDTVSHEELMKKFEESQFLVLTSFFEAFPTVVPEAMNNKNAVICTRYDGFSDELVQDGKTGFVLDFSSDSLAEKISMLMNDSALLAKMQDAAYENCKNFYKESTTEEI